MNPEGKKSKTSLFILLTLAVIALIIVVAELKMGFLTDAINKSQKQMLGTGVKIEYGSDSDAVFSSGSDGFICATKDRVSYYSLKGTVIWSQTFSLNKPYIIKDGENWAVLEPMGRAAYVCSPKGISYTIQSEHPILNASLNKIGCLLLVLSVDNSYSIQLFNASGGIALERKSNLEGVYPLCADISDDGNYFSIGYLDTNNYLLQSRILFFYTDVGAKKFGQDTQTPFTAVEKSNCVISAVNFIDGNALAVVSDNEIFVLSKEGAVNYSYLLYNRLKNYDAGDMLLALTNGEPFPNAAKKVEIGTAEWYIYSSDSKIEFTDDIIEDVTVYENKILLKSADKYYFVDKKGKLLWTCGASNDILSVLPIGNKKAVFIKNSYAEIYSYKFQEAEREEDFLEV